MTHFKSLRKSGDTGTVKQLEHRSEFHHCTKNVKDYLRGAFMLKLQLFLFYQHPGVVLNKLL